MSTDQATQYDPVETGVRGNHNIVSPSDTTVYTCAVKQKNGVDKEMITLSPENDNYNSNSDSSYEKYMTNQLEYCNISDEEPQLGCSHDLGQARKIDLARERIKACEAERNRV